ncbi:hypothetical protein B7P43_G08467 [Cryptotermes secundus]|uniref:Uncharacterized protein n=1 Tax=Cryptotermes secundus TaxID=105785 RepID=A0A2J7R5Z9_9NEOP|nr:hypothetical protein B7P43_G08467 [Cryptotermes secundus]
MIKNCDPISGQEIAHDLRFVGWGIVVEERPGTFLSIFRSNSKNSHPQTIEDSEIIIKIHCLTFWQKFLVNDSLEMKKIVSSVFTRLFCMRTFFRFGFSGLNHAALCRFMRGSY